MTLVLSAKGIIKRYRNPTLFTLLNDISIEVEAGESVAIMGKSGEGKTTLLHILGTLEWPTEGTVQICGEVVSIGSCHFLRKRKVGFIFQAHHLLEDYTVIENVLMPAKIAKEEVHLNSVAYRRALELLRDVGLVEKVNFPVHLLSGGEKQRTSIARALINDPGLILGDEPSGSLDYANARVVYELLLKMAQHRNKAIVIVTHDRELALLCKRNYLLKEGKLL